MQSKLKKTFIRITLLIVTVLSAGCTDQKIIVAEQEEYSSQKQLEIVHNYYVNFQKMPVDFTEAICSFNEAPQAIEESVYEPIVIYKRVKTESSDIKLFHPYTTGPSYRHKTDFSLIARIVTVEKL